jgi:hypothetical protein
LICSYFSSQAFLLVPFRILLRRDRSGINFIHVKDGLVTSLDEYWADDGDAPDWRKEMRIGKPIQ